MKFLVLILLLTFGLQLCFSQNIDVDGNWYQDIYGRDDYYTSYDFKRYSKDDVEKAKRQFKLIRESRSKDEWEGIYTRNTEIGNAELHWNSNVGFVYFHVYHTLASLDYGTAHDKPSSVKLTSQKRPIPKTTPLFFEKLIKVKVDDNHFLIPEKRLRDFADRAVGLSTSLSDFSYYWIKRGEVMNESSGLPIFPQQYSHLLSYPIKTRIVRIGIRNIYQVKFEDGTLNHEEIHQFVTLGVGKNRQIKIGMHFFAEDLEEWIEITKVLTNTSIGKITRDFDENKQEQCRHAEGGQGQIVPCKEIKVGMKATTKASDSYF